MIGKLSLLVLALFASNGLCVTEVWLADRTIAHFTSPILGDILGVSLGISKFWFDTLEECHIIMPDGTWLEAYPKTNLPSNIQFFLGTEPFTSCGVDLVRLSEKDSGTYELLSLVRHTDNSQTLTRQRNHITVTTVDLFSYNEVKP